MDFSKRRCICAFKKLGFYQKTLRFGSRHEKWFAPSSYNANPPFIMIPRHNEIHCQHAILKELERIGGIQLVDKFIDYL